MCWYHLLLYEATRTGLHRMCLETFSELIREGYVSTEGMSYTNGYNPPSKQDIEHSPPEYIPDPILFLLSTTPWIPRGGPFLPSRQATPEHWKSSQPPPAAAVPSCRTQRPRNREAAPLTGARGTHRGRQASRGSTTSPTTGANRCSNLRFPGYLTARSSFEPPARWSGNRQRVRRRWRNTAKRPGPPWEGRLRRSSTDHRA